MAALPPRYGSDYHLLRYLGYHRTYLAEAIREVMGIGVYIDWLDRAFAKTKPNVSREWTGISFLPGAAALQPAWKQFWPLGSGMQTWDAVGEISVQGRREFLLVEAKAHIRELKSNCKATNRRSQEKIDTTLQTVKRELGVAPERDWLHGYYQYCNRVAALYFLNNQGVAARLLFIYFYGDKLGPGVIAPQTIEEWKITLDQQAKHIGLPVKHPLSERIHTLFLPATNDHFWRR